MSSLSSLGARRPSRDQRDVFDRLISSAPDPCNPSARSSSPSHSPSALSTLPAEDNLLRPSTLAQFVGQETVREHLSIVLGAARFRGENPDHLLFAGPPGLGKTSLANIVAGELGSRLLVTSAPAVDKPEDLVGILSTIQAGDVLFIDEVHRLSKTSEEVLYSAMEDFRVDIIVGKGSAARTRRVTVPRFTLVGATTRSGMVTGPMRDRFGVVERLDFYEVEELARIVTRSAEILGFHLDVDGATEIGKRSRGTPRIANRLTKRVRDYCQMRAGGQASLSTTRTALEMFEVDELGLDKVDRAMLGVLMDADGPVGLGTLAATVGEDVETVEDAHEPYLLRCGLMMRTGRGRVVTEVGIRHMTGETTTEIGESE